MENAYGNRTYMTNTSAHPITVEVVRNAVVAYADEMAMALCKSAYNMMIYEVRDFCCGLIDTSGPDDLAEPRRTADLPRRPRRRGRGRHRAVRPRRVRARRRDDHEPRRRVRAAPQQRGALCAVLRRRRDRRVRGVACALGRHRRDADRLRLVPDERGVRRRLADALAENLRGGKAQRHAVADHQRQHALSRSSAGRHARADRLLPVRRAPLRRADRPLWTRHRGGRHRPHLEPGRREGARRRREDPGRHLYGRELPRQRRPHARQAGAGEGDGESGRLGLHRRFLRDEPADAGSAELRIVGRYRCGARCVQGADLARSRRQRRLFSRASR